MGIDYNKHAAKADYTPRNPFFEGQGDYLIVIQEMSAGENIKDEASDVCNWKVIRALRNGDPSLEGGVFCRRRKVNTFGTVNEIQNRVLVGLSMGKRLRKQNADPHFEFPKAQWTGKMWSDIHESNGKDIAGYPIVITCRLTGTKANPEPHFLAIDYRYPTAKDLEGITLDEKGRVVED